MKKYITHAIAIIVAIFIMTPPWNIGVTCQVNNLLWLWSVALAGFFTFHYIHTNAPIPIKVLVLYAYIGSFFSVAPYWSFQMTIPMIALAYFYLACRQIEDFEPVQKAVQSAFFLICAFLIVQMFGHDTLYNFNRPQPMIIGTIGNKMISATLITCLAPFLLTYKKLNIIPLCIIAVMTRSLGMMIALAAGITVYAVLKTIGWKKKTILILAITAGMTLLFVLQFNHIKTEWGGGRGPIWKKTVELTMKRHVTGYGISSYQLVFPAMSKDLTMLGKTEEWNIEEIKGTHIPALQTHNCWLQFWFELGDIGMAIIAFFVILLVSLFFLSPKNDKTITALTGLVILGTIMIFHFPTRLWHSVPVFICYLAFYETLMRKEVLTCQAQAK